MRRPASPRETQIRHEVIEDEIARLRDLPYSLWRDVLTRPMTKTLRGRNDRVYLLRTTATWTHAGSENIRVLLVLESRFLHRRLLRQSIVITPDNRFLE